jgi:hypothetical protein
LLQLGRVDAGRRGDDAGPGRLLIDGVPELRSAVVGVGNVPRQVRPEPELERYASGRDAPRCTARRAAPGSSTAPGRC